MRRVGTAIGLLALGAVVTVLVAWGSALWAASPPRGERLEGPWPAAVPDHFSARARAHTGRTWWLTESTARGEDPTAPGALAEQYRLAAGVPFRALERVVNRTNTEKLPVSLMDVQHWREGLALPSGVPLPGVRPLRPLPLVPLWGGLAADSALYAATFWLLAVGVRALRRANRRLRGLCPTCAYELRSDAARGCPECGWRRRSVERG